MKVFRYIVFLLIIYGTPLCSAMAKLWRAAEAGNRDPVAVELLRKVNEWKYKKGIEIIQEVLSGKIVVTTGEASSVLKYSGNVLCARVFVLNGGALETYNVPFIFVSGMDISPRINEKITPFIKNIINYNFVASSAQAYAHSERAFALSLLEESWYCDLFSKYQGRICYAIQIHNITNPMCNNCKSFLFNDSSCFIKMDEIGYFVTDFYQELYTRTRVQQQEDWERFLAISVASLTSLADCYDEMFSQQPETEDNSLARKQSFYDKVKPCLFFDMLRERFPIVPFIVSTHYNDTNGEYSEILTYNLAQK